MAGESCPLEFIIEAVGSAEDAARGEGPTLSVITSELEGIDRDILIADVIVDEGNGTCGSSIVVIVEFIVFGIGEIDLGIGVMLGELLFERDELVAFFGITGDREATDGELKA